MGPGKILTEEEMDGLLIGRHGLENHLKIKNAHVAIAGLGGLGSNVAAFLARAGVGSMHLVDFDCVDGTNLNRQFYTMKYLGMPKTEALSEELREISPYIRLTTDFSYVTAENAAALFEADTLICEAFDRAENKAMLVSTLLEKLPRAVIVAGSGMAGYASGNLIRTQQKMRRLYLCGDEKSDIGDGLCLMAPRVALCAAHQATMILRLILGETEA